MKRILICLISLMGLVPFAFAADISPTNINPADKPVEWAWTMATDQATSGDSNTAVHVGYCTGPKTLLITTSGAPVNITFTLTDDGKVISQFKNSSGTLANITSITPETIKITTGDHVSQLKVTSAITSGTVSSITLRCN